MRLFYGIMLVVLCCGTAMAQQSGPNGQEPPSAIQYPTQGNCTGIDISSVPRDRASIACPGTSATGLTVYGECFHIDNSSSNAYFIPLQTQAEWLSFRAAAQGGALVGVTLRSCGAGVDGLCGPVHGVPSATAPTTNLCRAGTASAVTSNSTDWLWTCAGSGSGATVSCSAAIDSGGGGEAVCITYAGTHLQHNPDIYQLNTEIQLGYSDPNCSSGIFALTDWPDSKFRCTSNPAILGGCGAR